MSFSVGQAQPTGQDVIMQGLGLGVSQGIQKSLESYQRGKAFERAGLPRGLADLDPQVAAQMIKQVQKNAMIQQILGGQPQGQASATGGGQPQQMEGTQMPSEQNPLEAQRIEPGKGMPSLQRGGYLERAERENQALASIDPNLARIREAQLAPARKAETARSSKYLEKIDAERDSVIKQQSALNAAENALANREFGFFSRDNLARITGIEGLASPEGAVFDAAAKNFFLADLESAMGRPNQFLERLLSSAIFNSGKSNEANEALVDFYKNQVDLMNKKVEIADNLSDFYMENTGKVPGNIGRLVDSQFKEYAKSKEKEMMEKYKDSPLLKDAKSSDFVQMRDPAGNIREVPKNQVNDAKKAKYIVIK